MLVFTGHQLIMMSEWICHLYIEPKASCHMMRVMMFLELYIKIRYFVLHKLIYNVLLKLGWSVFVVFQHNKERPFVDTLDSRGPIFSKYGVELFIYSQTSTLAPLPLKFVNGNLIRNLITYFIMDVITYPCWDYSYFVTRKGSKGDKHGSPASLHVHHCNKEGKSLYVRLKTSHQVILD